MFGKSEEFTTEEVDNSDVLPARSLTTGKEAFNPRDYTTVPGDITGDMNCTNVHA